MTRYDGVAFDLDGTLVDAFHVIVAAVNGTLAHFGFDRAEPELIKRKVGRGMRPLLGNFFPADRLDEVIEYYKDRYFGTPPAETMLLPGAAELLTRLHEAGVKLSVVSNKPAPLGDEVMDHYGLSPMLSAVLCDDGTIPLKPSPAMILAAMEHMGTGAKRTLYVGDMPIDVEAARAAGCDVAVLPTGCATEDELRAAGPDFLRRELIELAPIVLEGSE